MLRYAPLCSIPPTAESCQTSKGKLTATKKGKMRVAIPDSLARRQVLTATSGIIKKKVQGVLFYYGRSDRVFAYGEYSLAPVR